MKYLLKKSQIFSFSLLCLLLLNCQNEHQHIDPKIPQENIKQLKEKYKTKELNYFLETTFYSDGNNQALDNLSKWKKDILLFIDVNASVEDKILVEKCISKINALGLSIQLKIVDDEKKSNTQMFFGDEEYLNAIFNQKNFYGISQMRRGHGEIKSAKIGILDIFLENARRREALVLEELTQTIGISGDSYSYPNSIFYQGHNMPTSFSELDKKICQLLYDPLIPVNYSLENFKKDFAEKLHSVDYKEKMKAFFKEKGVSTKMLTKISETAFAKGIFYKHPKGVPVYINGTYNEKDIEFLDKSIKALNGLSQNIHLYSAKEEESVSEAGIYLNYTVQNDITSNVMSKITNTQGHTLYSKLVKSQIDILYKDVPNIDEVKHKNMLEVLYKALSPIGIKSFGKDWFQIQDENIVINDEYTQMLNILYDDRFIDALTQDEFEEIIKK